MTFEYQHAKFITDNQGFEMPHSLETNAFTFFTFSILKVKNVEVLNRAIRFLSPLKKPYFYAQVWIAEETITCCANTVWSPNHGFLMPMISPLDIIAKIHLLCKGPGKSSSPVLLMEQLTDPLKKDYQYNHNLKMGSLGSHYLAAAPREGVK